MANIVIKKRISFDFLGEDYKEGYIVLRSIPLREYEDFLSEAEKVQEDNSKSMSFILKKLEELFIEGKWPNGEELEDINKEDLGDLDAGTLTKVFTQLGGGEVNPK